MVRIACAAPALVLALALAGLGASCMTVSPPATSFASEPPGARVQVDGQDSGWITPCLIALDTDESHVVTLALDGYESREIRLEPLDRTMIIDWEQGVAGLKSSVVFPLLMPMQDLLLPFRNSSALAPGRVFVRLRPESAP
jgi:hypothetical protein